MSLDHHVVDGDLVGWLAVLVGWCAIVKLRTQRQKRIKLHIHSHIEMRRGLLGFQQTLGNGFAHAVVRLKLVGALLKERQHLVS